MLTCGQVGSPCFPTSPHNKCLVTTVLLKMATSTKLPSRILVQVTAGRLQTLSSTRQLQAIHTFQPKLCRDLLTSVSQLQSPGSNICFGLVLYALQPGTSTPANIRLDLRALLL